MLMKAIENQIFRHMAPQAVRYLRKPDLKTKDPLAKKVLKQAWREFQIAPPLTIHLSDPDLLAGVWHLTREAYIVDAKSRPQREAAAAAVSKLNECPYCVTVHAGMLGGTGNNANLLDDPHLLSGEIGAAYRFAAASLSPGSEALENPDVPDPERPKILATAIAYHYINRMVSIFLGDSPVALPGMASENGQKLVRASFAVLGKRIVKIDPKPGACVAKGDYLLPSEFSWAQSDPQISDALAHFADAAERAGDAAVPEPVRDAVLAHLANWNGEAPPLPRSWLEEAIAPLTDTHKPTARLALLSARAAYQVDEAIIDAFRATRPGDVALLQTVAWASFAAARRIASWMPGHTTQKRENNDRKGPLQ